jgi:SAM-dependent methyltransferase
MSLVCRICNAAPKCHHLAREMMYGTRETFDYFECGDCGALQIAKVPADLAQYYPAAYYSLEGALPKRPSFKRRLGAAWAYERSGGLLGWFFDGRKPNRELRLLGELGIARSDAILDVGCGKGARVARLRQFGFAAEGIDAHLDGDVFLDGARIARRATLDDVAGSYRLVMFHHSFEHLPDQHAAMAAARRLVAADGFALMRVPTCSSAAFDIYGTDWVQLDAPRHLYLHSRESFTRLAKQHGFRVLRLDDDSDGFQFWGSEQYKRDIPLADPRAHSKKNPIFSKAELAAFDARAAELNAEHRGDQFCAVLVPV